MIRLPVWTLHIAVPVLLALCGADALAQAAGHPKRVVHYDHHFSQMSDEQLAKVRERRRTLWAKQGLVEGRDYVETFPTIKPGALDGLAALDRLAQEVVATRPDLIITRGGGNAALLRGLTREIPIVFYSVGDPVLYGLVESLRRPGGNVTGVSTADVDVMVKLLELIREVRPGARRVAWLTNDLPEFAAATRGIIQKVRERMQASAAALGLAIVEIGPTDRMELDALEKALRGARVDAFVPYAGWDWVTLQDRTGVPGFGQHLFARNGGFAALGGPGQNRDPEQTIEIAARVLRGESPATIPVRLPSKMELTVNLKAAKALGIAVPASLLMRADEIIR
jgi:putative tryptophan/tyrosine transport system substrate-binding protein